MNVTEGLHNYEVVLIGLGILLFLILLLLLVYSVIRKQSIKSFFALFLVPVVMIAYPGYQKIRFENGVLEIEKRTEEVKRNPTAENKKRLENTIAEIHERPNLTKTTQDKIREAHSMLGD